MSSKSQVPFIKQRASVPGNETRKRRQSAAPEAPHFHDLDIFTGFDETTSTSSRVEFASSIPFMRSCLVRRYWLSRLHPCRSAFWPLHTRATETTRTDNTCRFTSTSSTTKRHSSSRIANGRPEGPEAWISLLDCNLPPHLRGPGEQSALPDGDAGDLLEVILAAQRLSENGNGVDLLYHLGIKQDRWRAVIWIVKHLVETVTTPQPHVARLSNTLDLWASRDSLDRVTQSRLQNSLSPQRSACPPQSLDELTGNLQPEDIRRDAAFRHEVLGSLWRSLGLMTIACADGEMRPEVLEIIAYLHHTEIMPSSIYKQTQSKDATAIQQPPMLRLFSSSILTSLSDAAWRAHERAVAEEARDKSGHDVTLPLDLPGASVRMISPRLRPEVWIELILWSCLHGGWILEGAATLRAIYSSSKRPRWRPLSWTSAFQTSDKLEDWDKLLKTLFDSRHAKRRDQARNPSAISVRRTVSSEVVNAYVDALLIIPRSGVGKRGVAPSTVLEYLSTLRRFLERAGLGLQSGSWDAIVLRFVDSHESVIDQTKNFETLVSLSPGLGEDINAANQDRLPQYVLDGSAATLGLFHRALRSRIARGDTQSAVRLFECLQNLADQNKYRSLVDFFEKSKLLAESQDHADANMFTSNFPGIEYPAFKVQIPPTVLGPFLELLTDAKAYDWGRWLIYNDDGFDEPILPESQYTHAAVAPALVRFASETRDSELLKKAIQARATTMNDIKQPKLTGSVLQSFVESQINLNNWSAAERVLQHDQGVRAHSVNTTTIAHLMRSMLSHVSRTNTKDSEPNDLVRARELLSNIVQGKYDGNQVIPHSAEQDRITLLLILLATLNQQWAEYCLDLRSLSGAYSFTATVKEFNLIAEGVVRAYGSSAGRRLLQSFWRLDARSARRFGNLPSQFEPREHIMDRYNPDLQRRAKSKRLHVSIPGHPGVDVVIYGGLRPNVMTVRIILEQAIKERKGSCVERKAASDTIVWAIKALNALQETEAIASVRVGPGNDFSESDLDEILHRLPNLSPERAEGSTEGQRRSVP